MSLNWHDNCYFHLTNTRAKVHLRDDGQIERKFDVYPIRLGRKLYWKWMLFYFDDKKINQNISLRFWAHSPHKIFLRITFFTGTLTFDENCIDGEVCRSHPTTMAALYFLIQSEFFILEPTYILESKFTFLSYVFRTENLFIRLRTQYHAPAQHCTIAHSWQLMKMKSKGSQVNGLVKQSCRHTGMKSSEAWIQIVVFLLYSNLSENSTSISRCLVYGLVYFP